MAEMAKGGRNTEYQITERPQDPPPMRPDRAGREDDQPLPVPGSGRDVLAELVVLVPPALQARRAIGIRRYGRPLEPWNGRDVHQDLDDELFDALAYARAAKLERKDLERDLAAARQAKADAEVLLAHARAELAATRHNLEQARADLSAEQAATAQLQAELRSARGW